MRDLVTEMQETVLSEVAGHIRDFEVDQNGYDPIFGPGRGRPLGDRGAKRTQFIPLEKLRPDEMLPSPLTMNYLSNSSDEISDEGDYDFFSPTPEEPVYAAGITLNGRSIDLCGWDPDTLTGVSSDYGAHASEPRDPFEALPFFEGSRKAVVVEYLRSIRDMRPRRHRRGRMKRVERSDYYINTHIYVSA